MPELNKCPYYMHTILTFNFYIVFDGKNGVDQHGGKWINIAENENSIIPEPVNPEYLDVIIDCYNRIQKFVK